MKRLFASLLTLLLIASGLASPVEVRAATASKLYFTNAIPEVSSTPATRGAWDAVDSVMVALTSTQSGPAASKSVTESVSTNNYDILILRGISSTISTAVTISGNLDYGIGAAESSTNANSQTHVHVWVMAPDGTNRGTLLTDNIFTNEWVTGGGSGESPAAQAQSSVNAQVGDRIVVEMGVRNANTSTSNFTMTMNYGGTGLSDVTDGGSASNAAWIDFGTSIDFDETFYAPKLRAFQTTNASDSIGSPAEIVAGDVMLVTVGWSNGSDVTPPAGWTQLYKQTGSDGGAAYWKVADTSDASAASFSFTMSGTKTGGIIAFSGAHASSPIDKTSTVTGGHGSKTVSGITPSTASSTFLMLGHTSDTGGCDPGGTHSGYTIATDNPPEWQEPFETLSGSFPNPSTIVSNAFGFRAQTTASGNGSMSGSCGPGGSSEGMALVNLVSTVVAAAAASIESDFLFFN